MCGLATVAPQRMQRLTINKNERNKLLKELAMAGVLAYHGYNVHLVEEDPRRGSYDALVDGIPADFKRTASHNNIKKYVHKAIYLQKAKIIEFQLDNDTPLIHRALLQAADKGAQIIYYFTDRLTEVFCINKTTPKESGAE